MGDAEDDAEIETLKARLAPLRAQRKAWLADVHTPFDAAIAEVEAAIERAQVRKRQRKRRARPDD